MNRKQISFTLLQTPVRLLYGCTFCVLALMITCWWYQWYSPLVAANRALENDLRVSFARIQSQKKSHRVAYDLDKKLSDFKTEIRTNKKDSALCSLVSLAQKNGLAVISARLCRSAQKSWCSLQQVQAECRGTYDQLITFFDQLSDHKPIVVCKSCDITRVDNQTFTARLMIHSYLI